MNALSFSENGYYLASASDDGTVKVSDVPVVYNGWHQCVSLVLT